MQICNQLVKFRSMTFHIKFRATEELNHRLLSQELTTPLNTGRGQCITKGMYQ